jgi:tetratricopeptide (TPR) repeat protein
VKLKKFLAMGLMFFVSLQLTSELVCSIDIVEEYIYKGEYTTAIELYKQLRIDAIEEGNKQKEVSSICNLGAVYKSIGNYEDALMYSLQCYNLSNKEGYKKFEAHGLNNLGNIYSNWAEYDKAISYYVKSLSLKNELNYTFGKITTLNNLGYVYQMKGDYETSLSYYKKALKEANSLNYTRGIITSSIGIGTCYTNLCYFDSAEKYLNESLIMAQKEGYKRKVVNALTQLGNLYFYKGDLNRAEYYYSRTKESKEEMSDKYGIATFLQNMGNIHCIKKDYTKAFEYYNSARSLFLEMNAKDRVEQLEKNKQLCLDSRDYVMKVLDFFNKFGGIVGLLIAIFIPILGAIFYFYKKYKKKPKTIVERFDILDFDDFNFSVRNIGEEETFVVAAIYVNDEKIGEPYWDTPWIDSGVIKPSACRLKPNVGFKLQSKLPEHIASSIGHPDRHNPLVLPNPPGFHILKLEITNGVKEGYIFWYFVDNEGNITNKGFIVKIKTYLPKIVQKKLMMRKIEAIKRKIE